MQPTYSVDPAALTAAAPKFDALAGDCQTAAKAAQQQASSLCDCLGDPSVVTAVGSAVMELVNELHLVYGGLDHLAAGVVSSASGYSSTEESAAARYGRTAAGVPLAG